MTERRKQEERGDEEAFFIIDTTFACFFLFFSFQETSLSINSLNFLSLFRFSFLFFYYFFVLLRHTICHFPVKHILVYRTSCLLNSPFSFSLLTSIPSSRIFSFSLFSLCKRSIVILYLENPFTYAEIPHQYLQLPIAPRRRTILLSSPSNIFKFNIRVLQYGVLVYK